MLQHWSWEYPRLAPRSRLDKGWSSQLCPGWDQLPSPCHGAGRNTSLQALFLFAADFRARSGQVQEEKHWDRVLGVLADMRSSRKVNPSPRELDCCGTASPAQSRSPPCRSRRAQKASGAPMCGGMAVGTHMWHWSQPQSGLQSWGCSGVIRVL